MTGYRGAVLLSVCLICAASACNRGSRRQDAPDTGIDSSADGDDGASDTEVDALADADADSDADDASDSAADADADPEQDADGDRDGGPLSCEQAATLGSTLGCEHWAVDLDNAESAYDTAAAGQFAVVVANPHPDSEALVTVEVNDAPYAETGTAMDLDVVAERAVAPSSVEVIELPRRDADGQGSAEGVDDDPQTNLSSRAFRVTSDLPIAAYQMNPIDNVFSNDGSSLLPSHQLGTEHVAVGYQPSSFVEYTIPGIPLNRAYVTIVGTQPGTRVTVTPTSRTLGGPDVPETAAGQPLEVSLGPFDMLNLETDSVSVDELRSGLVADLTGTLVVSTAPVAVFSGTDLSAIMPPGFAGEDSCCAEHLEEQMPEVARLGTSHVISRSPPRSAPPGLEPDLYRVVAPPGAGATRVTTSLAGELASFDLEAGTYRELASSEPFVLESTEPVLVAQLLVGRGATRRSVGDPSMVVFRPTSEWGETCAFATARGFDESWAVVAMSTGQSATLDGASLTAAGCGPDEPIGEIDGVPQVQRLCAIDEGGHTVVGTDGPLQTTVYGYADGGAYAFSATCATGTP